MTFIHRPFVTKCVNALVKYANTPKIAANLTNAFPHSYVQEHGQLFNEMPM